MVITMQVCLVVMLVLEAVSAGRLTEIAMEVLQPIPLGREGTKCRQDSDLVGAALFNFDMWAINSKRTLISNVERHKS